MLALTLNGDLALANEVKEGVVSMADPKDHPEKAWVKEVVGADGGVHFIIDETRVERVYFYPKTGKTIPQVDVRVKDVSPSGTPMKDADNRLFDLAGEEVKLTYVKAGSVQDGYVQPEDIYDLYSQGYEYKDNPKLFRTIPMQAPKQGPSKDETKPEAPVVDRSWKGAWKDLAEIKRALSKDAKGGNPDTQARIQALVGDDKYSGVLKDFVEKSIASGSPANDKPHQRMIKEIRDGKDVVFEKQEAKQPVQSPAAVVAEKAPLTETFKKVTAPAAASPDIMSQVLPPDATKFSEARFDYEKALRNSANKALDYMASGKMTPEQTAQAITAHKGIENGYGSLLEGAQRDFEKAGDGPKNVSGFKEVVRVHMKGRVDVAMGAGRNHSNKADGGHMTPGQLAQIERESQRIIDGLTSGKAFDEATPEEQEGLRKLQERASTTLEGAMDKVRDATKQAIERQQVEVEKWNKSLDEARPPDSKLGENAVRESALGMLAIIKDYKENIADLNVASRRGKISEVLQDWKKEHPDYAKVLKEYQVRGGSFDKAAEKINELYDGQLKNDSTGPASKIDVPEESLVVGAGIGKIEAGKDSLSAAHIVTAFCPLCEKFNRAHDHSYELRIGSETPDVHKVGRSIVIDTTMPKVV